MSSMIGDNIKVSLFGESHGECVGAVVHGLEAGIKIDYEFIKHQMNFRKANDNLSTSRKEEDEVKIVSGVFNDFTTGAPLTVVIENKNISVNLCHDFATFDATASLNTYKMIKNDFKNFYHKVLSQCAKSMVSLANAWREDDDTHEITAEEIYKRIDGDFHIEIRETNYTIYFKDDNIFL